MQIPRRMFPALLGLLLFATAAQAADTTLKETFQKTYPLKAGGQVALDNVNGGIKIEAWDKNEVQVVAEKRVKAGDADAAKQYMSQIRIDVAETAGGLKIVTRLPKRNDGIFDWMFGKNVNANVEYKLRVPRSVALEVENVNGAINLTGTRGRASLATVNGAIDILRAEGKLALRAVNGALSVTDSAGTVDAETTNGGIDVALNDVPDGADLSFETTNGAVTVRLPRDVRVSLDAATSNGRVHSDFEVDGGNGQPSRRRLAGDINGGGGKLTVRSTNGSVEIAHQ